jgi:hypothetical protein
VKQNRLRSLFALLGLALATGAGPADGAPRAQSAQPAQKQPAEAELPDVDAIEKGATPPASVSFQQGGAPNPFKGRSNRSTSLNAGEAGQEDQAVRQIEGAAVGLIPAGRPLRRRIARHRPGPARGPAGRRAGARVPRGQEGRHALVGL